MKNEVIYCECPLCGLRQGISVPADEWEAYCNGELAQNALVSLSVEDRETIISGLCPTCQEDVFGEENEGE